MCVCGGFAYPGGCRAPRGVPDVPGVVGAAGVPDVLGVVGGGDAQAVLECAVGVLEWAVGVLAGVRVGEVGGVPVGEALVRVRGVQRRVDAVSSVLGQRFAEVGVAGRSGVVSPVMWVFAQGSESWAQTRGVFMRGRVVSRFPGVGRAWVRGEISGGHVDVVGRMHTRMPRLRGVLEGADEAIAALAVASDPRVFAQHLRRVCFEAAPGVLEGYDQAHHTGLHVSTMLDGFVRVDGTLDPVLGSRLVTALEAARRPVIPPHPPGGTHANGDANGDANGEGEGEGEGWLWGASRWRDTRPMSQRNLDALTRILTAASTATGEHRLPRISGEPATVNLTVPLAVLTDPGSAQAAWLERFGIPTTAISGSTARELACDATLRPFILDRRGQIHTMLPTARTIHPALRRAILHRDQHCRFPHCTHRIDTIHHITHYSRGGPTTLPNLIGLCTHHHHLIHHTPWTITTHPHHPPTFHPPP